MDVTFIRIDARRYLSRAIRDDGVTVQIPGYSIALRTSGWTRRGPPARRCCGASGDVEPRYGAISPRRMCGAFASSFGRLPIAGQRSRLEKG